MLDADGARWRGAVAVGLAVAVAPALLWAANGNMPRTPALYPPHACLAVVDRSVDPQFEFAVHIPFEDLGITVDELPDSRTLQFFGLCRDPHRLEALPNWITSDDAQRALDAGIIDALPEAADVLVGHAAWQGGHDGAADSCVQVINAERLPISCEATADGVRWDTTAVPAGNYVIRGYTFAPASNLWTTRLGVVQVRDGDVALPVAALTSPVYDAKAFASSGYRVLGCMDGPPGTTVSLQWASTASEALGDDATWTEFATLDAADAVIDTLLLPPEQTVYLGLLVRAVASAPDGARWVGHAPGFVTVYPGDDASDEPVIPAPPDHCAAGGDTTAGSPGEGSGGPATSSGDGSDATSTGMAAADPEAGCGCRQGGGGAPWLVLCLFARRRARRGPAGWPRHPGSWQSVRAVGRQRATA